MKKTLSCLLFGLIFLQGMGLCLIKQQEQKFIQHTVDKYGLSPAYIRSILHKARYNGEVIARKQQPAEALPWYQYRPLFLTDKRIQMGVEYWQGVDRLLKWQLKHYRVPPEIIMAIIGIESNYGENTGDYNVLDSLYTLGFHYDSPKATYFRDQLGAFIQLCHAFNYDPVSFKGSYAGAMGVPQFMPGVWLHYGVDFQNNKHPDIFNDKADIIFSVGNFLRQMGWHPNGLIAVPARAGTSDIPVLMKTVAEKLNDFDSPQTALAVWKKHGVIPETARKMDPHLKANLIALKLEGNKRELWLVFHNFSALLRYNHSNLYAMAVTQLAQKLKQGHEAHTKAGKE